MYLVQDLKLIPQQKNMSCWYASAQMLIRWRRERDRMTSAEHLDPSQDPVAVGWEIRNRGITNPQVIELAKRLGLAALPPMTPSLLRIEALLRDYGPLWTNGNTHIVVIGGADQEGWLQVYDPAPRGTGSINWRRFQSYLSGRGPAARDTSPSVGTVFLYHP